MRRTRDLLFEEGSEILDTDSSIDSQNPFERGSKAVARGFSRRAIAGHVGSRSWLAAPAFVFLALFYLYPMARILAVSFGRAEGWVLAPLAAVLGRASFWRILSFTTWQAAVSTVLTLAVGLPGAYVLARYRWPGQRLFRALTAVPFVLPALVVAAAWDTMLGPRGWVNAALMTLLHLSSPPITFSGTFAAILVAHVFYNATIVVRLLGDAWSHLDPRLEAAARVLGADRLAVWRQVSLPLLGPAILAAALLVFTFDFTSFGVILVLGGPRFATLETEIYRQTVALFNLPVAAVLSLVQLGCTLATAIAYRALSRRLVVPLHPRPIEVGQRPLTTWKARFGVGAVVVALAAFQLLPLAGLAWRSVSPLSMAAGQGLLSTANYRALAENPQSSLFFVPPQAAIANSLWIAMITCGLALIVGLPAAWLLAIPAKDQDRRSRSAIGNTLDALIMLPLGTSAVTLGLGFILALRRPPLDLATSPFLLPIAHTLVALPLVVRVLVPALGALQPRLRLAAASLGADRWQTWRAVDLPLVSRALVLGAAFAFTVSLGEFGASVLLARPETPTLPVVLYRLMGLPGAVNCGQALALATLLMLMCAAAILAVERARVGSIGSF